MLHSRNVLIMREYSKVSRDESTNETIIIMNLKAILKIRTDHGHFRLIILLLRILPL